MLTLSPNVDMGRQLGEWISVICAPPTLIFTALSIIENGDYCALRANVRAQQLERL